jgi:hypothetical protein
VIKGEVETECRKQLKSNKMWPKRHTPFAEGQSVQFVKMNKVSTKQLCVSHQENSLLVTTKLQKIVLVTKTQYLIKELQFKSLNWTTTSNSDLPKQNEEHNRDNYVHVTI